MKPQNPPRCSSAPSSGRIAGDDDSIAAGKLAHALKTPLTGLELQLKALLDRVPRGELQTIVEKSIEDIHEMKRLLGDTIALGRAKDSTPISGVGIRSVVEKVLERLSALSESCNVRLDSSRVNDDPLTVSANRRALELTLTNVCENAILFSHGGGKVRIDSQIRGNEVHIAVTDDGIGMSKGETERAFEPYFKANLETRGSGLGLSIAEELTRAQGGSLYIVSEPGKGTTVTLVLPKAQESSASVE